MNVPARQQQPEGEKEPANVAFRRQLEARLESFAEALPEHITIQRFKSVINQAVMSAPELLAADRVSLFEACLAAANDGLVPDKKEGALVVYNTKLPKVNKQDRDVWIKKVQWIPMVRGVITKIYNTNKVKSVSLDIVYGGDHFRYWKDDAGEHLEHEPAMDRDKSIMMRVYAMVVMRTEHGGGVFAEVMDMEEIAKVKAASKTSNFGPWVDWFEEMAKKTTVKRLAKRLPIAREIEQVLSRDNFMYDMEARPAIAQREPRKSLTSRLDDLAGGVAMDTGYSHDAETVDAETGEITETQSTAPKAEMKSDRTVPTGSDGGAGNGARDAEKSPPGTAPSSQPGGGDPVADARRQGAEARNRGMSRKALPGEFRKDERLSGAWLDGFDTGQTEEREPGEEG